jgi:hypothetical protein
MASFAAFALVAALLTITPGADMAMVTRVAVTRGFRPATRTAFGIASGTLLWAVLSAVGLAALIAASATAFNVLKLVGAAYLTFLGVQALLSSLRRGEPVAAPVERAVGSPYRMGLFTNLLRASPCCSSRSRWPRSTPASGSSGSASTRARSWRPGGCCRDRRCAAGWIASPARCSSRSV